MKSQYFILILLSSLVSILIFHLPTHVVENDKLIQLDEAMTHELDIPDVIQQNIENLKDEFNLTTEVDKKNTLSIAIARTYLSYGKLDSAITFASKISHRNNVKNVSLLASFFYDAFLLSENEQDRVFSADSARYFYSYLVDIERSNLDYLNRYAMTLTVSDNPMEGIQLLRDILDRDPNNFDALFNLGKLSLQSYQYEKAIDRFSKLKELNPSNYEVKLFLSSAYIQNNQIEEAKENLEEILSSNDSIPAIKLLANEYLNTIQPK